MKRAVILSGGVLTIALIGGLVALSNIGDMCGNTASPAVRSPDGAMQALVFERDCGATTATSTQVSVIPREAELSNEAGNAFVIAHEPPIKPVWKAPRTLEIHYRNSERVFLRERKIGGVAIRYVPDL
jgi:hypothetical protein